jgi:hypothetical protein
MRSRAILLVLGILLIAGFAALNWGEFTRPQPLLFGPIVMDAPLGLIMLIALGLVTVFFLLTSAALRTQTLIESRHHAKTLEAQRELADKAEASRFTELRTHLDTQLRELRQRDTIAATEFEKAMVQSQRELRTQLEQMNRTLASRMSELEHRLDSRFERLHGGPLPAVAPARRHDHMPDPALHHEHAQAQQVRETQTHELQQRELQARELHAREERAREERLREERAHATDRALHERGVQERQRENPGEGARPAESGWRRWF